MREIVLILGAGASVEYRAPLMKDFFNIATRLYSSTDATQRLKDEFDLVFKLIDALQKSQAKANINLHNIEQIYSALEMAKLLKLDQLRIGKSWAAIENAMKYFLTKTIEARVLMEHSDCFYKTKTMNGSYVRHPASRDIDNVVRQIINLKNSGWRVSIITFNYDLVVESILATQQFEADYELSQIPVHSNNSITVLKLHGSINWSLVKHDGRSTINSVAMYNSSGILHPLNHHFVINNENKISSQFCETSTPLVIPPVWNKTSYHNQLANVWRNAADRLSRASHIYTLGYSLPETDGFFKHLYALGTVGQLPLSEFGVFDIEKHDVVNGVKSRYLSMLGRGAENVFKYYDGGASALADVLKHLQQPDL